MRTPRILFTVITLILLAGARLVAAADVAVWAYDFPRWSEGEWEAKAATLPFGTRHLYANVEDGQRFLLDDESYASNTQHLVSTARGRSGVLVHALMLQDTRWLDDHTGALERLARIVSLNRFRPEEAFAGVHVDVEPDTLERWDCGSIPERRALFEKLQALLARIGSGLPSPRRGGQGPLQFSAALPWWIGLAAADIPEASPRRFFESLDEIVLMAYGDPGGPLVGGSAAALLQRLDDVRLWRDVPTGKGIRIGLATYEYKSVHDLLATAGELDRAFAGRSGYRGTAIFHLAGNYGAPLTASVRGLVRDTAGKPVAGARVRVGERVTATNRCGRFVFRDLPASKGEIEIKRIGFQVTTVPVVNLTPGRELEIPSIVLSRNP